MLGHWPLPTVGLVPESYAGQAAKHAIDWRLADGKWCHALDGDGEWYPHRILGPLTPYDRQHRRRIDERPRSLLELAGSGSEEATEQKYPKPKHTCRTAPLSSSVGTRRVTCLLDTGEVHVWNAHFHTLGVPLRPLLSPLPLTGDRSTHGSTVGPSVHSAHVTAKKCLRWVIVGWTTEHPPRTHARPHSVRGPNHPRKDPPIWMETLHVVHLVDVPCLPPLIHIDLPNVLPAFAEKTDKVSAVEEAKKEHYETVGCPLPASFVGHPYLKLTPTFPPTSGAGAPGHTGLPPIEHNSNFDSSLA